jgi:predicted O-methyltransferase YrrM
MEIDPLPTKTSEELKREQLFRDNVAEVKKSTQTVDIRVGRSFSVLADLITEKKTFDFIYVDGNHASHTTLADGVMCFGMLRPGGIMLFDDYLWDHEADHMLRPKTSVDAFCNQYRKYLEFVFINYQLAIIKK